MTGARGADDSAAGSLADESERLIETLLRGRSGSQGGGEAGTPEDHCDSCGCAAPAACSACPVCRAAARGGGAWSVLAPSVLTSLADAAALVAEGLNAAARALRPDDDASAQGAHDTDRRADHDTDHVTMGLQTPHTTDPHTTGTDEAPDAGSDDEGTRR